MNTLSFDTYTNAYGLAFLPTRLTISCKPMNKATGE